MIRPSKRLRAIQYGVVAQLSAICMINYMDRATLAIANPAIRHDMGLLLSVFPLTYALDVRDHGPRRHALRNDMVRLLSRSRGCRALRRR